MIVEKSQTLKSVTSLFNQVRTESFLNKAGSNASDQIGILYGEEEYYPGEEMHSSDLVLITKMLDIPKCTILKSGKRLSMNPEIYFYCSCDPNKINQICEECAIVCHKSKGHSIQEQPPAKMKCSCGEKAHNVIEAVNVQTYMHRCFFHELSIHSGLNLYYLAENDVSVCMLCFNFCKSENFSNLRHIHVDDSANVPVCSCRHENHNDNRKIFNILNEIAIDFNKYDFSLLQPIQFVNLLFKCEETFKNLYYDLNDSIRENFFHSDKNEDQIDKKIDMTNFFHAIKNFTNLGKIAKFKYFNLELIKHFQTIFKFSDLVLESKFFDDVSLLNFIYYLLFSYENFIFEEITKTLPKFKISDLENMSILQRISILSDNKNEDNINHIAKIKKTEGNIISEFIRKLHAKINRTKFKKIEVYDIITKIATIYYKLLYFNLLDNKQIADFCKELQKSFSMLNEIRATHMIKDPKLLYEKETLLYLKISKFFHLAIIMSNDREVRNILESKSSNINKDIEKIKFIHNKSEVGRHIARINVKILMYITDEFKKENKTYHNIFKKILKHSMQILNYFANSVDPYVLGFKNDNHYGNLKEYFDFLGKENAAEILSANGKSTTLNSLTSSLDGIYYNYCNFNTTAVKAIDEAVDTLKSFFTFFFSNFSNQKSKIAFDDNNKYKRGVYKANNFSIEDECNQIGVNKKVNLFVNRIGNNNESAYSSHEVFLTNYENMQNLGDDDNVNMTKSNIFLILLKSNFIFTAVKGLSILNNISENYKLFVNLVYKLALLFIEGNNSDNSMLIFTKPIFSHLRQVPFTFAENNFELFLNAVNIICSQKLQVSQSNHIVKSISKYLLALPTEQKEKFVCLNYSLKIFDQIVKLKSLNYNLTLKKLKEVLKNIFEKFSIISEFSNFLLIITEDILAGKIKNRDIEELDSNKRLIIKEENQKFIFSLSSKNKFTQITNSMAFNIFYLFLKLSNDIFDSSCVVDRIFLISILKREDIVFILKNKALNLKIRCELLKIFRKTNIDILIHSLKICKENYVKAFGKVDYLNEVNHINTNGFPAEIYAFNQKLIKISEIVCNNFNLNNFSVANPNIEIIFDVVIYELIFFELKNFKEIIKIPYENNNKEIVLNYLEFGLISPLNIFLKKNFSKIVCISGEDYLKIVEMIPYIMDLKKFLVEKDFLNFIGKKCEKERDEADCENFDDMQERLILSGFKENKSLIAYKALKNASKEDIERDLYKLRSKSFQIFNYTLLHLIIDNHLFSILQKPESMNLSALFSKRDEEESDIIWRISNDDKSISDCEKKLQKLFILYTASKGNLEAGSSSLAQNMFEICLESESTYMHLILKFLIFVLTFDTKFFEQFALDAYFILLKLLQYHTETTQDELEKIIELAGDNVIQKYNYRRTTKRMSNFDILKSLTKKQVRISISNNNSNEMIRSEKLNQPIGAIMISEGKSGFLINFTENLFYKLTHMFVNEFNLENSFYNSTYVEAFNIIKILRFLCEEHNNFFQGQLLKKLSFSFLYQRSLNKINFFDMLLLILNNLLTVSDWNKVKSNDFNIGYFYDLFSAIIELLIEIIQGNSVENLTNLVVIKSEKAYVLNKRHVKESDRALEKHLMQLNEDKNYSNANTPFQSLIETCDKSILFDDVLSNETLYRIRTQLMNLFIAFLEEKNCPQDVKDYIIESIVLNKILSSLNNTLKKYFLINTRDDKAYQSFIAKCINKSKLQVKHTNSQPQEKSNSKKIKSSNKDYKLLKFDNIMYQYFYGEYFVNQSGFPKSPEFEFANTLYRFIKIISIPPFSIEEASYLVQKVNYFDEKEFTNEFKGIFESSNDIGQEVIKKSYTKFSLINEKENSLDSNFGEMFYLIKFFEKLTQTVEVYDEDSEQTSTVIFTLIPNINFLSKDTKMEFLDLVNRDNQYTKLQYMVSNVDYFKKEIEYNSTRTKNKLFSFFMNLNYSLIQVLLFILVLAINFLIFILMTGDNRKIYNYVSGTVPEANVTLTSWDNSAGIDPLILYERDYLQNLTGESARLYSTYYNYPTYLLIFLCVFFIICYIVAKLPLYYEIELIRYLDKNKVKRSEISIWTKMYLIISEAIIQRDHINSLLFMTISGTIAIAFPPGELEIFYSFMVLTVVNLSPTLKNIMLSIRIKFKDLLSTLLLTLTFIYAYSNIGFYAAHFRFEAFLDMREGNYCDSLVFCFLTHTNGALRIPGGIGDFLMSEVSFEKHGAIYAGRLLYDFIWFCIINVTLLNIVFGIIIDTFKELRIKEQKKEHDRNEVCFICGITKDSLEKERTNYKQHVKETHNIWNYVNYMIGLKFSNLQDLNAINSYTLTKINAKNIKWIPLRKNKKREKGRKVEEENMNVDTEKYNEKHANLKIRSKN